VLTIPRSAGSKRELLVTRYEFDSILFPSFAKLACMISPRRFGNWF
jgi:hypothetical protein